VSELKKIDDYLEFLLQEKGDEIQHKGQLKKALITDVRDNISFYNDKFIRTDFEIQTGETIEYQESKWIIVSEIDKSKLSYRARLRKSNYRIKMVIDEVMCELDTIIEGISFGIEEGKYMNFEDGKIEVTIPAYDISNKIDADMRFIKMDKAWKVVGVDKSKIGLNILHCEKDLFGSNDDKENEIADKNKIAIWEIKINEDNRQVALDKEFIFTATVNKNGAEDTSQKVAWQSSDESIAIIDNGVVDGLALGKVIISAFIQDKPSIKTSIELEVLESLPDIINYKMWSSYTGDSEKNYEDFSVRYGSKKNYGAEKYINGIIAEENDTYTFTLDPNGVPTSKYGFKVIDGYKCEISHNEYHSPEQLKLIAESNESGEVIEAFIQLKSLW
jgi:hypothetical protein